MLEHYNNLGIPVLTDMNGTRNSRLKLSYVTVLRTAPIYLPTIPLILLSTLNLAQWRSRRDLSTRTLRL